jgi:hypothetical protein
MNRTHPSSPSPGQPNHPKGYRPQALSRRKPTLRTYLTRYAGAISVLAVLIVAGALGKTLFSDPRKDAVTPIPTTGSALFLDLTTGKTLSAPDTLPGSAVIGPDMKAGLIRSYVLSCDACATKQGQKTIYLEVFTAGAVQKLHAIGIDTYTQLNAEQPSVVNQTIGPYSRYIRLPEQNKWVAVESKEAKWVLNEMSQFKCKEGNTPTLCLK